MKTIRVFLKSCRDFLPYIKYEKPSFFILYLTNDDQDLVKQEVIDCKNNISKTIWYSDSTDLEKSSEQGNNL